MNLVPVKKLYPLTRKFILHYGVNCTPLLGQSILLYMLRHGISPNCLYIRITAHWRESLTSQLIIALSLIIGVNLSSYGQINLWVIKELYLGKQIFLYIPDNYLQIVPFLFADSKLSCHVNSLYSCFFCACAYQRRLPVGISFSESPFKKDDTRAICLKKQTRLPNLPN